MKAEGQVIQDATDEVNEKYAAVRDTIYKDSCVPVCKLEELIKQLSKHSSPDMDGVTTEHLTHCMGTDLINKLFCASTMGSFQTVFALVC